VVGGTKSCCTGQPGSSLIPFPHSQVLAKLIRGGIYVTPPADLSEIFGKNNFGKNGKKKLKKSPKTLKETAWALRI